MFLILVISEDGRSIICEIYNKHHKRMLYTAIEVLGISRGEDAVHDVFAKLLEKFEDRAGELSDKPGLYFVIATRNHSYNLIKKDHSNTVSLDEELMDKDIFQSPNINPADDLLETEALERLALLIRKLNPKMRQILEYRFIEGYTNREIADILNVSQSVVSTRIDRAKKRLKELLESGATANSDY